MRCNRKTRTCILLITTTRSRPSTNDFFSFLLQKKIKFSRHIDAYTVTQIGSATALIRLENLLCVCLIGTQRERD
jgi:hypothetical protein